MNQESTELLQNLFKTMNAIRRHNGPRANFSSQTRVLWILAQNNDQLTQSKLSELLDIRPSSTSELLKKLESKGLITRGDDPADRRITIIKLTAAGKEVIAQSHQTNFGDMAADLTAGLTKAEISQLNQLLQKMRAGIGADDDEDDDRFGDFHRPGFRSPFGRGGFNAHRDFFNRFF